MNVQSPHRWWSTLKSAVFVTRLSLPPLVNEGGGLVCESVRKADLLSYHFDSKQSREAADVPRTDPLGVFPLFLKRTADVIAPRLSVVFLRLVRLGSFPPCWRQENVTPIPKGPPSSSVANYRPTSITSVLSKVFERLVPVVSVNRSVLWGWGLRTDRVYITLSQPCNADPF